MNAGFLKEFCSKALANSGLFEFEAKPREVSCETVIGTLTGVVSTGPNPGESTACASAAVPG